MNLTDNQSENNEKKSGSISGFLGRLFKKRAAAEDTAPAQDAATAESTPAPESGSEPHEAETPAEGETAPETAPEPAVDDEPKEEAADTEGDVQPAADEAQPSEGDAAADTEPNEAADTEPSADAADIIYAEQDIAMAAIDDTAEELPEPELPELPAEGNEHAENEAQPAEESKITDGEPDENTALGGENAASGGSAPKAAPQSTPQKNDYTDSVRAVRRDRVIDSIICAAALIAVIAGGVWSAFTDYRIMGILAAAALAIPLTGLLVKNLWEAGSVADIAYRGVYAARLTREQQTAIRRNMLRQGQRFYLICFLAVVIPESAILIILSRYFDSGVFLIIMAIFALTALACVLIASLFLSSRLNVRDAFCTVSTRGIITSHEVIPFSSKAGDVDVLVKFDDYYMIRYKRAEIFGLRHNAVLLFPADGVLKTGLGAGDDVAAVLAGALGLSSYKVKAAPFAESVDFYGSAEIRSSATV